MVFCNISVIIVNWNSWDLLARCLEALEKQTISGFSTIVLDNGGSNDSSSEIMERFTNVSFYRCNFNSGFAAANNELLKMAGDCEWIATLNPDAFPEPNWLEELVKAAINYPDYSFFASRLLMADLRDRLDGDGDTYHICGLAWRTKHGSIIKNDKIYKEVFSACAAAGFYRRDALVEIGGFDEDFFCYFEDVDIGFRLRLRGKKCLLVTSAIVNHIGSATSGGRMSDFSIYHGHRNMVWGFVKNMPGLLFWIFLPFHILINFFSIIWFSLKKRRKTIIKSKVDALRGLQKMWLKRKEIQSNRVAGIIDIIKVMDKCPIPMIERFYR